jgi:hypothetical protein
MVDTVRIHATVPESERSRKQISGGGKGKPIGSRWAFLLERRARDAAAGTVSLLGVDRRRLSLFPPVPDPETRAEDASNHPLPGGTVLGANCRRLLKCGHPLSPAQQRRGLRSLDRTTGRDHNGHGGHRDIVGDLDNHRDVILTTGMPAGQDLRSHGVG